MKFLAIDFGTSNCVAAYSRNGEVSFVPLEDDKSLLPSVIYVQRRNFSVGEWSESEFERALADAKRSESVRIREHEKEILISIKEFDKRYAPRRPQRPSLPKKEEFDFSWEYDLALEKHAEYTDGYLRDMHIYEDHRSKYLRDREIFEEKLRDAMSPRMTDKQIEELVGNNLRVAARRRQESQYQSQTFFDAFGGDSDCYFGSDALRQYALDPDGGFYFRSPKSFLGSDIGWLYAEDFTKVVETILCFIKQAAERFCGEAFDGVVLGRPVNYHGTLGEEGNLQAMQLMSQAAKKVGFDEVRFFLEPVAAAMTLKREEILDISNFLVVDVGGGTTDCAFLKISGNVEPRFKVLSFSGDRVGGCDIDQSIAWRCFMPYLGKGSKLRSGLSLPQSLLYDAISTRNVPAQQRFHSSDARWILGKYLDGSTEPRKLRRLLKLRRLKLQHLLLLSAENLKISHSDRESVNTNLDFLEEGLSTTTMSGDIADAASVQISAFKSLVEQAISQAEVIPDRVFVTGGVMRSKDIFRALTDEFPPDFDVRVIDLFLAVGRGLGAIAGEFERDKSGEFFKKCQEQGYSFSVQEEK